MSGTVTALNEFKVRGVSGSAKTFMRGSFTFYMQNSYAIAQNLPACPTDIAGSFACAVVGCKPTVQQLQRLFGARRSKVQALYDFMLDKDNLLAGVHELAREAHFSEDNLRTFDEDGGIPSAILDALFPVTDKSNTIGKAQVRRTTPAPEAGIPCACFHMRPLQAPNRQVHPVLVHGPARKQAVPTRRRRHLSTNGRQSRRKRHSLLPVR